MNHLRTRFRLQEDILATRCRCAPPAEFFPPPKAQHNFMANELALGWIQFELLRGSPREWKNDEDKAALQQDLSKLPNLVEVTPTACGLHVTHMDRWNLFVRESDSVHGRELGAAEKLWLNQLTTGRNWDTAIRPAIAALTMLEAVGFRASASNTTPIARLTLRSTHQQQFQRLVRGLPEPRHDRTIQDIVHGFSHLTNICVHNIDHEYFYVENVHHQRSGLESTQDYPAEDLPMFLGKATQLRTLTIATTGAGHEGCYGREHMLARLVHIPASWPHLEYLHLSVAIEQEVLLCFLKCVAPSLRTLELQEVFVFSDAQRVLLAVPKILALDRVYIEKMTGCFEIEEYDSNNERCGDYSPYTLLPNGTDINEPQTQAFKAYLLRQRDVVPDLAELIVDSD